MVCLLPHPLCTELGRATWILPEGRFLGSFHLSWALHLIPIFLYSHSLCQSFFLEFLLPLCPFPSGVSLFSLLWSLPTLSFSPLLWTSSKRLCVPFPQFILSIFLLAPRFHSPSVILHPLPVGCLPLLGPPPLKSLSISSPFPHPFLSSHLPFSFPPQPISSSFSSPLPSPNQLSPIPFLFGWLWY